MIDQIYFEEEIEDHPRTQEFFARFPKATLTPCLHYKEVFNPVGQNFRLQKQKPGLILAKQNGKRIQSIPESYGIGGKQNFYFSHLLNCLYDCRYCFLQGMYPSAHYVLFVNYEEFWDDIFEKTSQSSEIPTWFFSGYDCDSLAMESTTRFVEFFLPLFAKNRNAHIELRTKSVNIRILKKYSPSPNIVTAFSFTPEEISEQLENGVPKLKSRIKAMLELAHQGWLVGIRIDPVIDCIDFENRYAKLFNQLIKDLPLPSLHSVSLGSFRMPTSFFRRIEKLYPHEPLFAGKLTNKNNSTTYLPELERNRLQVCKKLLLDLLPQEKLFLCEMNSSSP